MDIRPLLPKEHILLGLQGADRRGILRALCAPLVHEGTVTDAEAFLAELEAREAQITTQMEGGIAFPHARSQAARHLALVVGLAAAPGLDFSGPRREPCRAFFLIAVSPAAPTAHLPLLRHLSAVVRRHGHLGRLLEAHTPALVTRMLAAGAR